MYKTVHQYNNVCVIKILKFFYANLFDYSLNQNVTIIKFAQLYRNMQIGYGMKTTDINIHTIHTTYYDGNR